MQQLYKPELNQECELQSGRGRRGKRGERHGCTVVEGFLTDGRREARGSEQRVVIRPGHLAKAQRAPSSRRSLTR